MLFKNNKDKEKNNYFKKIAALLIHSAKIDENYSLKEEEIIKKTLVKIGAVEKDIEEIIKGAIKIEENSNQILEFTKEVKNLKNEQKTLIIETLWRIIYSDKTADIYETNLMRRLGGLLYIDNKIMGNIKEKIKKEISQ